MSQLPLEFPLAPHSRFETFVAERDDGMLRHLRDLATGARAETVWLAGEPNSGKTHLLQAACREAGSRGRRTMFLSAAAGLPAAALEDLGELDLLAIDDVTRLAGDPAAEQALFSVVNDFYAGAGALLLAARAAPAASGFRLPDLASRASGAIVYRLQPLSDSGCALALALAAAARGIEFEPATAAYLLRRVRRDMRELVRWLDLIDREALAQSRHRVTVPFVRDLLLRHGAQSRP